MINIKQKFHHFSKWEDYNNGLFNSSCERYDDKVKMSIDLLSDQEQFLEVANEMISKWTYSAEQNLTDNAINKKAWVGQASCCFNHEAPDYATKDAWWQIPEHIRIEANKTAGIAIAKWRAEHIMEGSLWQK